MKRASKRGFRALVCGVAASIAALGLNGHLALIGALDGFGGTIDALPLIFSALRVSAVMVGSRRDHEELSQFMAERGLKPVIDSTYPFDQAEAAYARAGQGAFGKVVVKPDVDVVFEDGAWKVGHGARQN